MAHGHELADQRSLVLHREVARRLRADPNIAARGRARVEAWAREGGAHATYIEGWLRIFEQGVPALLKVLEDPGQEAQALRQVSPFAFVLEPRERWQLLRRGRAER
jgi:hypothetical protein